MKAPGRRAQTLLPASLSLPRVIAGAVGGLVIGSVAAILYSGMGVSPLPSKQDQPFSRNATSDGKGSSTTASGDAANRISKILNSRGPTKGWKELTAERESLDAWMMNDPVGCINFLQDSSMLFLVQEYDVASAFLAAAGGDLLRGIDLARNIHSGAIQKRVISHLFGQLVARDPGAAFDALGSLPEYLKRSLGERLAKAWGKADPRSAAERILSQVQGTHFMFNDVTKEWARVDPEGIFNFLLSAPDEQFRAKFFSKKGQLSTFLAAIDPQKAMGYLERLPSSAYRDGRMAITLSDLVAQNPHDVEAVISRVAGSGDVVEVLSVAALNSAQENPSAARMLVEKIPGERYRAQIAGRIAMKIALGDVKKAEEWAASISDPLTRVATEAKLKQFGRDN